MDLYVSVSTTVGVRWGASFGNNARMDGSSSGPADPVVTVIGLTASQSPPSQNPLHTSGSITRAGSIALSVRFHVPVPSSISPTESQIWPGTSPENVPVHASTR